MSIMYINQEGRSIDIGVDGYKPQNYYDYTLREAIKKYREENGLVGNHFRKYYGAFYACKGAYGRYYYYLHVLSANHLLGLRSLFIIKTVKV